MLGWVPFTGIEYTLTVAIVDYLLLIGAWDYYIVN